MTRQTPLSGTRLTLRPAVRRTATRQLLYLAGYLGTRRRLRLGRQVHRGSSTAPCAATGRRSADLRRARQGAPNHRPGRSKTKSSRVLRARRASRARALVEGQIRSLGSCRANAEFAARGCQHRVGAPDGALQTRRIAAGGRGIYRQCQSPSTVTSCITHSCSENGRYGTALKQHTRSG